MLSRNGAGAEYAGGPSRSLEAVFLGANKINLDLMWVSGDRDLGGETVSPKVVKGLRTPTTLNSSISSWFKLAKEVLDKRNSIIYLNSFFDFKYSIYPQILLLLFRRECLILLASRGELSANALLLKRLKKSIWVTTFKMFLVLSKSFNKRLFFHASTSSEKNEIKLKSFVSPNKIFIAIDQRVNTKKIHPDLSKINLNQLNCTFASRISEKKNLLFLIEVLKHVKRNVNLEIWGAIDDPKYWSRCQFAIGNLPSNITVDYCGPYKQNQLSQVFKPGSVFVLPSLNENFGHVIYEALLYGAPVLLSDNVPWLDVIEYECGCCLSLDDKVSWISFLEKFELTKKEISLISDNGHKYLNHRFKSSDENLDDYKFMFKSISEYVTK